MMKGERLNPRVYICIAILAARLAVIYPKIYSDRAEDDVYTSYITSTERRP